MSDAEVYAHYWDQSACTNAKLLSLVPKLRNDAIVIIHGDHGARVTWIRPDNQDDADMHQTVLFIRKAHSSARHITDKIMLPALFRDLIEQIAPDTKPRTSKLRFSQYSVP
jgi:hypothetical protein